jgi:hypothetical protein
MKLTRFDHLIKADYVTIHEQCLLTCPRSRCGASTSSDRGLGTRFCEFSRGSRGFSRLVRGLHDKGTSTDVCWCLCVIVHSRKRRLWVRSSRGYRNEETNFGPVHVELHEKSLPVVSGALPADLEGEFVRNGPNNKYPFGGMVRHGSALRGRGRILFELGVCVLLGVGWGAFC